MKYMHCNFNGDVQTAKTPMKFDAQEISQRDSLRKHSLILIKDGEIEEDVKH